MLLEVIFVCGDGVVLLEYGSEADVVDDDEALAAAVLVAVSYTHLTLPTIYSV